MRNVENLSPGGLQFLFDSSEVTSSPALRKVLQAGHHLGLQVEKVLDMPLHLMDSNSLRGVSGKGEIS